MSLALIASATFLLVAVAAGRRNPAVETPDPQSGNGGFLFVAGAVLLITAIFVLATQNHTFRIVYAVLAVILLGIYLIFDTQLIVGNKQNKFTTDDYIFASMCLYIDITRIFLELLVILGNKG